MSRIGRLPIKVPSGTTVSVNGNTVTAKGAKGTLSLDVIDKISVNVDEGVLRVGLDSENKEDRKFHGLYRSLINNIVVGVSEGFTVKLELVGVGYKAQVQGNELVLDVGFSMSKRLQIPEGVTVTPEPNNVLALWSIDKQKVGQFAANVRKIRPPEPYKGKGIRYQGEKVRRKAGKAGAMGKGG